MSEVIGGGGKKVLYTLSTVKRIGLRNSAKALKARNTCKACGLGMGGQMGGMTNEKGEFPSVCNKSIQAQSTDIQPPIPADIFQHDIPALKQLTPRELEHLGRLGCPLYKAPDSQKFEIWSWDQALELAIRRFRLANPEKTFFYSSGRSSNEAAFVLQLFARLYGSNHVNNCSYYCHQATGVGLKTTLGTGTSTVELEDLSECDLFFLIGANPASNHPRLIHQLKGIRDRGGEVIVINPAKEPGLIRFAVPKSPKSLITGGNYISSDYLQPRIGSDLWLLKGLAKAILELGAENSGFILRYSDGFDAFREDIEQTGWTDIETSCGLSRAEVTRIAKRYARARKVVFAWGMGITHHLNGCDNVEYIANLALLRGMAGQTGAGLLPLRGHSNIQGVGTVGVKPVLKEDVIEAIESRMGVKLPRHKGFDTLTCLEAAERGEVDVMLAMGGNLFSATPNRDWARKALDRIGLKIFLTTTLNQGHLHGLEHSEALILPVAARDEETQATTQESMFNFVRLSDGGIQRLDNIRTETEILISLAEELVPKNQLDFNVFREHREIRQAIAHCVPGMEDLKDIDVARKEFHIRRRLIHEPEFFTPNGRAQFVTRKTTPRGDAENSLPFTLSTIRSEGQFNSIIYEETDSYRSVTDRQTLLMNAEDLMALGLQEGDAVTVRSDTGLMENLKVKAFDLPRGNAMTYYPEANVLVNQDRDPRSKTPSFKSVAVQIEVPCQQSRLAANRPQGL